jgi:hypothetical protein
MESRSREASRRTTRQFGPAKKSRRQSGEATVRILASGGGFEGAGAGDDAGRSVVPVTDARRHRAVGAESFEV